ncbi:MAG: hypothetical protein HMLKMBBP_02124 [Planctomycetes bacterium]|nr:hypothetical protein [Planctomycetota bacterium]
MTTDYDIDEPAAEDRCDEELEAARDRATHLLLVAWRAKLLADQKEGGAADRR